VIGHLSNQQFLTIVSIMGNSWFPLTNLFKRLGLPAPCSGNWTRAISRLRERVRHTKDSSVIDAETFSVNPSFTLTEIHALQAENAKLTQELQKLKARPVTPASSKDTVDVASLFRFFNVPPPPFSTVFSTPPKQLKKSRQAQIVTVTLSLLRHLLQTISEDFQELAAVVFSSHAFRSSELQVLTEEQSALDHPAFRALRHAINASSASQRTALLSIVTPFFTRNQLVSNGFDISQQAFATSRKHSKIIAPGIIAPTRQLSSHKRVSDEPVTNVATSIVRHTKNRSFGVVDVSGSKETITMPRLTNQYSTAQRLAENVATECKSLGIPCLSDRHIRGVNI